MWGLVVPEPRAAVLNTPFDEHGGPDGRGQKLLDFSVNSNPFGPPAQLLLFLESSDLSRYPDPTACEARVALAQHHGVEPERVVMGNGTAELIHRVAACYLQSGKRVVIATPTFGEYRRASSLYGAEVANVDCYLDEQPDASALLDEIHSFKPALVWLCHPNNPTGHAWSPEQLAEVAVLCSEQDALLCLDAAYLSLSEVAPSLPEKALQFYSLTKSFCIPGLRVGYATAPVEVAQALRRVAAPWQASTHAQRAAIWAVSQAGQSFLAETVPHLLEHRNKFQTNLTALGASLLPTQTSFFLCEVGNATALKREAEEAGFRVRDGSSFGLPNHIRLATRLPEDNQNLLEWWARCD